jgi:hypothetical protein
MLTGNLFFALCSIKKKVKGGNTTGGSRTLPSSNSSPVHTVPPPPHTGTFTCILETPFLSGAYGTVHLDPHVSAVVHFSIECRRALTVFKWRNIMLLWSWHFFFWTGDAFLTKRLGIICIFSFICYGMLNFWRSKAGSVWFWTSWIRIRHCLYGLDPFNIKQK